MTGPRNRTSVPPAQLYPQSQSRAVAPLDAPLPDADPAPQKPARNEAALKFHSRRHLTGVVPVESRYVTLSSCVVQVSGTPMVSIPSARAVPEPSSFAGGAGRGDYSSQVAASAALPPSARAKTMASALDLYNDHFGLAERPFS